MHTPPQISRFYPQDSAEEAEKKSSHLLLVASGQQSLPTQSLLATAGDRADNIDDAGAGGLRVERDFAIA